MIRYRPPDAEAPLATAYNAAVTLISTVEGCEHTIPVSEITAVSLFVDGNYRDVRVDLTNGTTWSVDEDYEALCALLWGDLNDVDPEPVDAPTPTPNIEDQLRRIIEEAEKTAKFPNPWVVPPYPPPTPYAPGWREYVVSDAVY